MNIFIRADSSKEIGTGHIMRCLVLAEDLRKKKVNITFICRKLQGNLMDLIKTKGFHVRSLPPITSNLGDLQWHKTYWDYDAMQTTNILKKQAEVEWLIIDHYAFDIMWEHQLKPYVKKIMVIDDLANRPHDCDLLLDQNVYKNMDERYAGLVPYTTKTLLGIKYLLLRQEYRNIRNIKKRNGLVNKILISFGGSDPTNETMKALKAINMLNRQNIHVDVVVGFSNQNYQTIQSLCAIMPQTTLHYHIDYLADLMAEADLAIGAGGSTTWERCYVCLPAITIETARNQTEILTFLSEVGAIRHLGVSKEVSELDIANTLHQLLQDPKSLINMMDASLLIMKEVESNSVAKQLVEGE
ncbi:UDP-2,4-diacetamido-2,4,6-trideoxy-beta-L-altropyranose hydrolase [Ornithinibacillus salinisoli]|uniref:UDP-2,4-diacetamido-2,4, 6-trideoxy-beta-L-altropyranose hydrolase n=1 Tax=Ornithinibacillus salinisoli TaxID=1848459 RepID=A0ABW4W7G1_9BACI